MASRRNQILAAVKTALDAPGKPAAVKLVARSRGVPVDEANLAAILIYPQVETIDERAVQPRAYRSLHVLVDMRQIGEIPDEALDPVYVWVVKQMQLDPTFGGLAFQCFELQTQWDNELADEHHGRAVTEFEIRYFSNANDPEQP